MENPDVNWTCYRGYQSQLIGWMHRSPVGGLMQNNGGRRTFTQHFQKGSALVLRSGRLYSELIDVAAFPCLQWRL